MIEEYINHLRDRGLAPKTRNEYRKDLSQFIRFAQAKGWRWSTISSTDVLEYQAMMHARGLNGHTINKRITALRGLFHYMRVTGKRSENPCTEIISHRTRIKPRRVLDIEGINEWLVSKSKNQEEDEAKLLAALLLESGARIGEVTDLRIEDLDQNNMCATVIGKGLKPRTIYYGKRTAYMLYKRERQGRLFSERSQRWFRGILAKYADAQLGEHCNPHTLRHTFATTLREEGCSVKDIGMLLGHASTQTTERYIHPSEDYRMMKARQYAI